MSPHPPTYSFRGQLRRCSNGVLCLCEWPLEGADSLVTRDGGGEVTRTHFSDTACVCEVSGMVLTRDASLLRTSSIWAPSLSWHTWGVLLCLTADRVKVRAQSGPSNFFHLKPTTTTSIKGAVVGNWAQRHFHAKSLIWTVTCQTVRKTLLYKIRIKIYLTVTQESASN